MWIYLVNGILYASILFLISAGLTVIFGVVDIINFAHGSFFLLGIYTTYLLMNYFQGGTLFYFSPIIAALIVGAVGSLFEKTLLKRTYGHGEAYELLMTFAMILVIDDVIKMIWGGMSISNPALFNILGTITLLKFNYPLYNFLLIIVTIAIALSLWLFISKTELGEEVKAVAYDHEMAEALGINSGKIFNMIFFIGSFLAGLAGGLTFPITGGFIGYDIEVLILSFAVLVIGGLGSIEGALIASIIVGVVRAFGISFFPRIELGLIYAIMVIVLVIKPQGLMGGKR